MNKGRQLAGVWSALALLGLAVGDAHGAVTLAGIFGENMVLQRGKPIPVWGWAAPDEAVTVTLGKQSAQTKADAQGRWQVNLPAAEAGGPLTFIVAGQNTLTFTNVLVGDVWLCSGQSNMELKLGSCNAQEDVTNALFPAIRCCDIPNVPAVEPKTNVVGRWQVCTPGTAPQFTAAGFYFARTVHQETGIPIGLLESDWGGTTIETWISPAGLAAVPELKPLQDRLDLALQDYRKKLPGQIDALDAWVREARAALAEGQAVAPPTAWPEHPISNPGRPTGQHALYLGMIHPLIPYGIRGALWYQGEANGGDDDIYFHKLSALIGGWRQAWGEGDFPFYIVQLPNFSQVSTNAAGGDGWARIRMAQLKALSITNVGLAITIDIGETGDIHPKDKADVGKRLALWALAKVYGKADVAFCGPLYREMKAADGKIRLIFDHAANGLMVGKKTGRAPVAEVKDGKLQRFAVAGDDKQWAWADAVIDSVTVDGKQVDTVVVSSAAVPKPVAVRYAYSGNPEGCNLYNRDGLPAAPFRTDNW